ITENARYHLLGDAAYKNTQFLLTPYRTGATGFTVAQRRYNRKHCATRVKIENAFGLLKKRWRQLKQLEFWSPKKMSRFVFAVCVLHNICIANEDLWGTESEDSSGSEVAPALGEADSRDGAEKRDRIANGFV